MPAPLRSGHPAIRAYHRTLGELRAQGTVNELGLRRAFESLLACTATPATG